MKETFDNKLVPSRCYYYLLDFNDSDDLKTIISMFPESEGKLMLLDESQFWQLWQKATSSENVTKTNIVG